MQLVVESAGVAYWFSILVASPERRCGRLAVGAVGPCPPLCRLWEEKQPVLWFALWWHEVTQVLPCSTVTSKLNTVRSLAPPSVKSKTGWSALYLWTTQGYHKLECWTKCLATDAIMLILGTHLEVPVRVRCSAVNLLMGCCLGNTNRGLKISKPLRTWSK